MDKIRKTLAEAAGELAKEFPDVLFGLDTTLGQESITAYVPGRKRPPGLPGEREGWRVQVRLGCGRPRPL
jgi:hypothetical protein